MKDMKKRCMPESENGSVLIIALVMLVMLTVLGISAARNAEVEIQIAGNDKIYKENLYTAEAGVMEAAQTLKNTDLINNPPTWLETNIGSVSNSQILGGAFWVDPTTQPANASFPDTRFFALAEGIAPDSSLEMGKSKVYSYRVFGRTTRNNGLFIVEMGYRKAF